MDPRQTYQFGVDEQYTIHLGQYKNGVLQGKPVFSTTYDVFLALFEKRPTLEIQTPKGIMQVTRESLDTAITDFLNTNKPQE